MIRSEIFGGAGEGRDINTHPKYKNLGGETSKKGLAVILSAILVISAIAVMPAIASDWPQFQANETNIGRTGDSAPITTPSNWSHHTAHNTGYGINVVPLVVGDYVYVLASNSSGAYIFRYYKNGSSAGWTNNHSDVVDTSGGFQLSTPAYGNGTSAHPKDTIFVANNHGKLYAINATSGAKRWDVTVCADKQLNTPVTYYNDGSVEMIFFGDWNGDKKYYCYNVTANATTTNHTEVWNRASTTGQGYYWSGAAVIGDYLVYGDLSSNVTSVYNINGTTKDEINISKNAAEGGVSFNKSNASAILSSIAYVPLNDTAGFIYFTCGDYPGRYWPTGGYVWKIGFNKSTGEFFDDGWSTNWIQGGSTSTPSVYKGKVYVGIGGSTWGQAYRDFYCLNASNGNTIWTFTPNGIVQSSPVISTWYDNGTNNETYIYFTTNCASGRLYCLKDYAGNTAVNSEEWYYEPPAGKVQYTLQGAAISGGWAFYGNDAGYLFGISNWTRYDFNVRAGTDKWAYEGQVSSKPPSAANDPSGATVTYTNIEADDGTYETYTTTSSGNYAAHRFNFSIDENEVNFITKINVTWNGIGKHDDEEEPDGARLYIYNFSAGSYGSSLDDNSVSTEDTLTGEKTSSISNYISSSGNVTILVEQRSTDAGAGARSHIETDYVKLVVTP